MLFSKSTGTLSHVSRGHGGLEGRKEKGKKSRKIERKKEVSNGERGRGG